MLERLLEGWLDNATERAYQTPFCQMLVARGHKVIHNTRHAPTEFGKDVITVDPDGRVCAFQLKGNPSTRLTLHQFREIHGQLLELIDIAIPFPGLPRGQHRAFLVTNGEVEEEVQLAIDGLNRQFADTGHPAKRLEIITRGILLGWANELGAALWPSELQDINLLLELMVHDGRAHLPIEMYHRLLCKHLRLSENDPRFAGAGEFKRHVTSTALAISISLRNFASVKNHFAQISAWTLYATYVIAATERNGYGFKQNAEQSVRIAIDAVFSGLVALCDEISERKNLIEGNAALDGFFYRVRLTLLFGLMSIYWMWSEEIGWSKPEHKEFLRKFLPKNIKGHFLWGEAAVPQFLAFLWCLERRVATTAPERLLTGILEILIQTNKRRHEHNIPSPYYDAERVLRHLMRHIHRKPDEEIARDSFGGSAFYAGSLMYLLVRTNMKQTCQALWEDFTRLGIHDFEPEPRWAYGLWRSEHGDTKLIQPSLTKSWTDLVEEARECAGSGIPKELKKQKYLSLMFVILCPHRGNESTIRFLGRVFSPGWFIPAPIEAPPRDA